MHLFEVFVSRISKDFRQKELLPLKLLFFVHASTLFVLYPYLTIHMRELGINVEETAIMSAVTPVVAIVMPPIAGMVADRIGNFRILLSIFSSLGGAASLLLLLVPVGRVTVTYPERVILDVGCSGGFLEFGVSADQECNKVSSLTRGRTHQVDVMLEACGFLCHTDAGGGEILNYDIAIEGPSTETHSYELQAAPVEAAGSGDKDLRSHRLRKNDERFGSSVRRLSNSSVFFPTADLYNLTCQLDAAYRCTFGTQLQAANASATPFRAALRANQTTLLVAGLSGWAAGRSKESFNTTCSDAYNQVRVSAPGVGVSGCAARCLATAPRRQLCTNSDKEELHDIRLTFWSYMVVRVFIGMIGGTAFAMFEGAVIAILREQNADYGLQRIYATIGGMISSPLSGMLIDYASHGKGYTDFRPAFYLYAALKIVSGLLMLTINLEFKPPATNVISDVVTVLKNIEIVALFIAIFVLGTAWGYIESFLFWLLQDLGGSRSLMGITITVGGIAGIPLLALSGPIIDKIGHANVLFIGFIFYAIRLLGYSLIYNPWLCLVFEAMEGVTSSLSFTAAVTYAAKLSTTTTDSSIQGLLGGVYFGVGKGAGSLIGGYLMKAFGTRPTYRVFSVACTVTGIVYFFFNKFYLRKRPQVEGNDIVKKPKSPSPGELVEVDLSSMQKEKEKEKSANHGTESLPINTTVSKSYSSADVSSTEEPDKQTKACSDNAGYEDDGDGYATIDEESGVPHNPDLKDSKKDVKEADRHEKDHDSNEREKKNDSV